MKKGNLKAVSRRRKYAVGGQVSYGNEITSSDIKGKEVGAAGNYLSSVGTGAAAGAAIGSIVPGIGTVIGGAVGAVAGFFKGLFGNKKRKRQLAKAREAERQQQISYMESRLENDYESISDVDYGIGVGDGGYYAKYGGRYKLAQGGIVPNSSSTSVAYGATHDQINSQYGGTGVPLGDVEVEGGGDRNGRLYPGEVIYNDGEANNVFSDRLTIPGTKQTYADVALKISSNIGRRENKVNKMMDDLEGTLDKASRTNGRKAKGGRIERNAEKLAYKIDIETGKIGRDKAELADLFGLQERHAMNAGYREAGAIMACGGRRRMADGGSTGSIAAGIGFQAAGSIFNWWQNENALKFESNLPLPYQNTIQAPKYNSTFNVDNQISTLNRASRSAVTRIQRGTNNPQVARSAAAKAIIDASEVRGQIYTQKGQIESQLQDRNTEAQFQVRQYNENIKYQNAVDQYNRAIGLNMARNKNNQALVQGLVNSAQSVIDLKAEQYAIDAARSTVVSDADKDRLDGALNRLGFFGKLFNRSGNQNTTNNRTLRQWRRRANSNGTNISNTYGFWG